MKARYYDHSARPQDVGDYSIVELHTDENAVVQASRAGNNPKAVLVRVWPPNGTDEYGGSNLTCLSAVISFTEDGRPIFQHISVDSPTDDKEAQGG